MSPHTRIAQDRKRSKTIMFIVVNDKKPKRHYRSSPPTPRNPLFYRSESMSPRTRIAQDRKRSKTLMFIVVNDQKPKRDYRSSPPTPRNPLFYRSELMSPRTRIAQDRKRSKTLMFIVVCGMPPASHAKHLGKPVVFIGFSASENHQKSLENLCVSHGRFVEFCKCARTPVFYTINHERESDDDL